MWTELAYAIALTDFWMRIRRAGADESRRSLIVLLKIVADAAVDDAFGARRLESEIRHEVEKLMGEAG